MNTKASLNTWKGGMALAAAFGLLSPSLQAQSGSAYEYPSQEYAPAASTYSQPPAPTYVPPPSAAGQPAYAPPPGATRSRYVNPVEFLPTFGRRFGDMFRRVFYGDAPPAYQETPRGRNLDAPPSPAPAPRPRLEEIPPPPPRQEVPPAPPPVVKPKPSPAPPAPAPTSRVGPSKPPAPRPNATKPAASTPEKLYRPPTLSRRSQSTPNVEPPAPPVKKETPSVKKEPQPVKKEVPKLPPPPQETVKVEPTPPKPEAEKPMKEPEVAKKDPAPTGSPTSFLKGRRGSKEGRVISPYPPYQELDVTGLSSGSLALDPTTQKVFEVP